MHNRSVFYLGAFLFFFHSSVTIMISFLPIYFQNQGISGTKIGLLMAVGSFVALFTQPFWGFMSDKYKSVKMMVLICLVAAILTSIMLFQMNSFILLFIFCGIFFSFMSPIGALGDSLALKTTNSIGISFGKVRMWGSIGFALTSLIGGMVLSIIGINNILYVYLVMIILTFAVVWKISDVKGSNKPIALKNVGKMISNPPFFVFLICIMFVTIPHRMNDSFMGMYIVELGGSESLLGWALFIGVGIEALVLLFSGYWLRFFNEVTFLIIAASLYAVRWFLVSIADSPIQVMLLHSLHGLTFGIFYLCAFQFITRLVPKELISTGHLLFISVFFGMSGIIGSVLGGTIFDRLGGTHLYQISSYFTIIGVVSLLTYHLLFKEKGHYEVKVKQLSQ